MFDHQEKNLKDLLKQVVHENAKLEKGIGTVKLEKAWAKQMDGMINNHTSKMYFRNGILTVYINSSTLRNQLQMNKSKVIGLLNEECGLELVKEVVFR